MPGSTYHKIGDQVAEWLSTVKECQINSSTKTISDSLKDVQLEEDEEIISFDVSSLYTNVPVTEAIEVCADLLYSGRYKQPPVDKETFIQLAQTSSCNVLMSTPEGYMRQVDGLAMGSPPAPHFANGWLSQFDPIIMGEGCKLFSRYMDDIIMIIKRCRVEEKLSQINSLHPNLKFTCEREVDGKLPFLDMMIINTNGRLSSTWYNKPTDTGLIMNFHALAPKKYKWSVVSGFVYRIYRACNNWEHLHTSLEKAKRILERNQYPPDFYEPIIKKTLQDIVGEPERTVTNDVLQEEASNLQEDEQNTEEVPKKLLFIQYRGKCTEAFARALHRCKAPGTVVMTLRKLKTVLPSLKPSVEKKIRSGVVYKVHCPRCRACYVGCTTRHLITRSGEHRTQKKKTMARHLKECQAKITCDDFEILASSSRGQNHLETLEALFIREINPQINTKDEYRSKELTIKLVP